MAYTENVIINEEELRRACSTINTYSNNLEDEIRQYISVLNSINKSAIASGEFSDAIKTYTTYVRKLQHQTTIVVQKTKDITNRFIQQVDNDDSYIY